MIKEALQYLVSLKGNKTYEIHGDIYSDRELVRVEPHVDRPEPLTVTGLDSLAQLIRHEADLVDAQPIFVRVDGPRSVTAFSSWDDTMTRDQLYKAECDAPAFQTGWMDHEEAVIKLRSMFETDEDSDLNYVLDLLSRISRESSVSSSDNGVTQTVEARQGVALSQRVAVRPRVALRPYRTFLEVLQPKSEFLLRLDGEGRVGLLEADGGMWRMDAKKGIAWYLEDKLKELVEAGRVVVMM